MTQAWASHLTMCIVVGALFLQVVSRYFGWQVDWTEELARFSFILMVFASASYASACRSHLKVSIFTDMAERWTYSKWAVQKVQLLATFVFDCIFCWYASANVYEGLRWPNVSPSLGINENLLYLAPAVGFAAAIIQRVLSLFDDQLPEGRPVLP